MSAFPFSSYIVAAIFALAAATTVGGALVAVLSTRIIRGVCGLMICCIGLAGLYYFLQSPFLALMEILVYVGAVCVTIVFGVMLSETDEPKLDLIPDPSGRTAGRPAKTGRVGAVGAVIVCTLIAVGLARISLHAPWPDAPATRMNDGSVAAIGIALLTTYSLAFELISLVLLLAILGALVIARSGRDKPSLDPAKVGILTAQVKVPDQSPPASTSSTATTAASTRSTPR